MTHRGTAVDSTDSSILCQLLWKLSRKHTWVRPIQKDSLVRLALSRPDWPRGRELLDELVVEPYMEFDPARGYRVKNDPDSQALVAVRLTRTCAYPELTVEATLSRFVQAGGFDAYDVEKLQAELDAWIGE